MPRVLIDGHDAGNVAADWIIELSSKTLDSVRFRRKGQSLDVYEALNTFVLEATSSRPALRTPLPGKEK